MEPAVVSVDQTDGECVVTLSGDIDVSVTDSILNTVTDAMDGDSGSQPVVIDMTHVTFLDSGGLGLLVEIQQRAQEHGTTMRLRNVGPRFMRLFEVTGLDTVFDFA
jgi:anti-anti-sigma factor